VPLVGTLADGGKGEHFRRVTASRIHPRAYCVG
jgi:hypothetical protein